MAETDPTWSFTNSRGRVITTGDATTAEKYRHDPAFTEVTDTPAVEQVDDDGVVKPYTEWRKSDLEAEVARRNTTRGADGPFVVVDEPGNKPELVAGLEADDAANPSIT